MDPSCENSDEERGISLTFTLFLVIALHARDSLVMVKETGPMRDLPMRRSSMERPLRQLIMVETVGQLLLQPLHHHGQCLHLLHRSGKQVLMVCWLCRWWNDGLHRLAG